jgi:hypothetical protein
VVVAVLAIGACATPTKPVPRYQPPISGPSAKLVMRGAVPSGDVFGIYVLADNDNCQGAQIAGAGNNTRNPPTTSLAANRLTTVDFVLYKPNKQYCLVRWSFTPAEGRTYLMSGAALKDACQARLLDASDPDNIKVERGAVRRNTTASRCVPMAQARTAAGASAEAGHVDGDAVLRQSTNADDLQGLIAK